MGEESATARYAAEFVGTFMLIFTVGCNVITGQPVWGGVSIACVLTVMIYALGKSSGGNFNPAVSVALGVAGKMQWGEVAIYCVVQLLAGMTAAFAYVAFFGMHLSFNLAPTQGHTWWQACLVETIYTFMLCFVVLNVAASKLHAGQNQFYGLAIGFVVVAGAYGAGSVSMGCFNPAVALALDTASFWIGFQFGPLYTVFELIGGVLAALLFKACRPEESSDEELDIVDGKPQAPQYPISSRLLSEFLGTYILVLTVGLNVLGGSKAGAFSIAASLMCMIFALGTCSGEHFNPAVTVAIVASGRDKCSPTDGLQYIIVQILGGVLAAFTYGAVMSGETFALKPALYSWNQVAIAEFVFTFCLAFVVLSVATVKNALSQYFGFAIGMCVTVGGCAIGKISGGSLNPAVSIGISSSHIINGGGFWPCLVYALVEILAGAVAAGVFRLTQPSEFETDEEAQERESIVDKNNKKKMRAP
jgi:aquaporin Z